MFSLALAFLRPMIEVLSQLCFLNPMLKFIVQTFYQPVFSIFPSAILLPSVIIFLSKSFPHQKAQSKAQKAKAPLPPSGWSHCEGRDIVTGEIWVPASLNTV
jgi:hypothetical protein